MDSQLLVTVRQRRTISVAQVRPTAANLIRPFAFGREGQTMRRYAASLQPDEVNLLSQFLQEELDRRHLTREGVAAEKLAAKIFSLYQAGR
jgi:hypothetical protein